MSEASEFLSVLFALGDDLGRQTVDMFRASYLTDWPDEEASTGSLFGALEAMAMMSKPMPSTGLQLKVRLTTKRDEAQHGADALIRFRCTDDYWQISTNTLIQAKRQEPGAPLSTADHDRLKNS